MNLPRKIFGNSKGVTREKFSKERKLKSFPTRLEIPDSRRRRKLSLHVQVNKIFYFNMTREWRVTLTTFKAWFVNHFVLRDEFLTIHTDNCIAFKMYAMFSNDCGLVLTGHGVYTDRSTHDGNRRFLYRSLSASNPENGYLRDFCMFLHINKGMQIHFAVNEKWLTARFLFLDININISQLMKNG